MPTVPTIAVRETDVSRHNGGTSGAPLRPLRDDSALRALSSLRGLRGAPEAPPLCRETQSLGQQMLNATVGINGLMGCRKPVSTLSNDGIISIPLYFITSRTFSILLRGET